jgi:hypothetical protein
MVVSVVYCLLIAFFQHTEIHQPIRRSHILQQRQQQRENSNDNFSDEDSKYRVESSKQIITIRRTLYNFAKIII